MKDYPFTNTELHILIIENNEDHLYLIEKSFRSWQRNYCLSIAKTLSDARQIIANNQPDIAFLTLNHHNGDVRTFLTDIISINSLPIIVMLRHEEEQFIEELLCLGALDYLIISEHTVQDIPHTCERSLREWDNIQRRIKVEEELTRKNEGASRWNEEFQTQLEEIRQANYQFYKNEEKYRQLFEKNIVPSALHEIICDESGNPVDFLILEVNAEFLRTFGYLSDNIIGKTVKELIPNFESFWIEKYGEVALSGKSVYVESYDSILDRYFQVSVYSPVIGQFVTLSMDITDRKKAEIALQESEERLRFTLDATNDAIWDWNIPANKLIVSSRWYTMLGYEPDEMAASYTTWRSLIHPDDLKGVEQKIQDHITQKIVGYGTEARMLTKQGDWKWILFRGKVVEWDEEGKAIRMVGTHTDISERKQIDEELANKHLELKASYEQIAADEKELKQNESWFRGIFNQTYQLTGVLDLSGRLIQANNISLDFIEKELGEVVNVPFWETPWLSYDRDGREKLKSAIHRGVHGETSLFNVTMLDKVGGIHYTDASLKPIKDPDGIIIALLMEGRDNTTQKLAEIALKESEERLRLSLDAIKDGIWDWNIPADTLIVSSRWYTMLGHEPSELAASYTIWRSLIHPENLKEVEQKIQDHFTQKTEVYRAEARMLTKQGNWKWILFRGKVVERDEEGNPVRMVGTHTDISERKQVEEELANKHFELMASYEQIAANEEELKQNFFVLSQREQMLRISEERLIMAQEIAHVGCWEFDLHTKKMWASAEGSRIFGFPPVARDFDVNIIEASIPEHEQVHQAAIDLITFDREYNLEYTIHPADGSPPKIVHSIAQLEKDEMNNPLKVRGAILDITDLKRKEEALRESNTYLENLIKSANVPIIIWDPSFIITRQNRAFELLTGRSAEEVVGHSLDILFPPSKIESSMQLFRNTLAGVRWETVEIEIQHTDGSIRNVIWNSSTLYSVDGETPIATIAQGQDITIQKKLEKERNTALEQIKQNLAQLAILNDGIRNPLTIIDIIIDTIDESNVKCQIFEQTKRIDEMVKQLDQRWMESDKILGFLKKHHQMFFNQ